MSQRNVAECIKIVLRMTPEQRVYCMKKISKHFPSGDIIQAQHIFKMAEKIWKTTNNGEQYYQERSD